MKSSRKHTPIKNARLNLLFTTAFFLGILLLIWIIDLYRDTLLPSRVPTLVFFVSGTVAFIFGRRKYAQTYGTTYYGFNINFFAYMNYLFSIGSLFCFMFIATNYYLAEDKINFSEYKIINKSSMAGGKGNRDKRQPLVYIIYDGLEKELVFGSSMVSEVSTGNKVVLGVSEGFLGYDVIRKIDVYP